MAFTFKEKLQNRIDDILGIGYATCWVLMGFSQMVIETVYNLLTAEDPDERR